MVLPANPLSIELTVQHRQPWVSVGDDQPELWHVSADVNHLVPCIEVFRHVGDLSIAVVDLRHDPRLTDSAGVERWVAEFIVESVVDHENGRLHPELEGQLSAGVPRLLILRTMSLIDAWRGHGLAEILIAGALKTLAPGARLAACRVSPEEFADTCPDPVAAELASVRMAGLVERLGFSRWRGVHVADLKSPALLDARFRIIERLWPYADDSHA